MLVSAAARASLGPVKFEVLNEKQHEVYVRLFHYMRHGLPSGDGAVMITAEGAHQAQIVFTKSNHAIGCNSLEIGVEDGRPPGVAGRRANRHRRAD